MGTYLRHPITGKPVTINVIPSKAAPSKAADTATPGAWVAPAEMDTEGAVTARIATLGVRDLQDDVIALDALGPTAQAVVLSQWNHSAYADTLPVGTGRVVTEGSSAMFYGRLLMGASAGRDLYQFLKAAGGRCPWSFGFVIVRSHHGRFTDGKPARFIDSLVVTETSPVIAAAGVSTGTVYLNGRDSAELTTERQARERQRAPADEAARKRRASRADLADLLARSRALGIRT